MRFWVKVVRINVVSQIFMPLKRMFAKIYVLKVIIVTISKQLLNSIISSVAVPKVVKNHSV